MNLDEIEDLIRRYLSAGITVVIILVAPPTGGTDEELAPGEPSVVTIDPDRPEPDDTELDDIEPGDDTELDPRVREAPEDEDLEPDPADEEPDVQPPGDDRESDRADDPAEDREDGRGDETDSTPTPDDQDTDDQDTDDQDTDDQPIDDTGRPPADREDPDVAEDYPVDDYPVDEDTGDPDAADPVTDDPDLESRGPADDDEPGIEDEDGTPPGRDPADDDLALDPREPTETEPTETEPTETADADATAEGTTAAERFGWGTPDREDDFGSGLEQWEIYDGPGHAGEGLRSPDAVTVQDGVLTITGDAEGTTGGMTWTPGQRYGRWEGRVRAPASDPSYNALLLLWPDAEDFPEGGEIDFMEMLDPTRQRTEFFLHHGPDNDQVTAQVEIDGTEWHNWAVEWTPEEIVGYVDGEEWFRTTDTSTFPPGPMHLCIQLDWFPDGAGEVRESMMEVDWVRQYALDPADQEPAEQEPADDEPSREVVRTEPAAATEVAIEVEVRVDPLRRMFSWS